MHIYCPYYLVEKFGCMYVFVLIFLHDYGNNNLLWHIVTLIQNDLQLIFMLHLIKSYILYKKYRQSRRLKNTGSLQKTDVLK